MKAVTYHEYGPPDVLELVEVDKPTLEDDQVLVKVHAASVNPADWHMMTGTPWVARLSAGLRKPKRKVTGLDVAGTVEAVGAAVTRFQPGDEVFGEGSGTFAEYAPVREKYLIEKPANLTFEQAGAVGVAGFTALQGLQDHGNIQAGDKVLINGASGGVGTFAVQIAKAFGVDVTGVCSTRNVEMVRSIGADHVIDYTKEDFTKSGEHYDLILDAVGTQPLSDLKGLLTGDGIYVAVGAPKRMLPLMRRLIALALGKNTAWFVANASQEDLVVLHELLESGEVTPIIDRTYPLSEAPEAFRYQGEGHAQGKTVITV
jgi:NADPH:quinone reductase-like Zn-dependent oxidoreductase